MAVKEYDVIVIGAGPSGTSAGRTLSAGGLRALIIEENKLPRHKMCTGLVSKWTADYMNQNFGGIPEGAYADNPYLKGIALNFPSLSRPVLIPTVDPTPFIRRDNFDYFLAERCGAEIKDGLQMTNIEHENNGYKVTCKVRNRESTSKNETFFSKYLIAADGSNSRSVRKMLPDSIVGVPRVSSVQMNIEGRIDLDHDYFHGFFHRGIGFYSWVDVKSSLIQIGASALGKRSVMKVYRNFENILTNEYGLEIKKIVLKEGMTGLMMGIVNKFILGKDNFLVAGDACGVMHNGGEGISCALTTGNTAGNAIILAENSGKNAMQYYRENIEDEINLCLDQFNPLRMGKVVPFNVDTKAMKEDLGLKDYYYMYKDFKSYLDQDLGIEEARIGRVPKRNMYHKLVFNKYPVEY